VEAIAIAATEAEEGSRKTVTAPRAGERSIVVVVEAAIVVVEDDRLGAPASCPRIRSRTLGRHQILHTCHRTRTSTRRDYTAAVRDFAGKSSTKIRGARKKRRFLFASGTRGESRLTLCHQNHSKIPFRSGDRRSRSGKEIELGRQLL